MVDSMPHLLGLPLTHFWTPPNNVFSPFKELWLFIKILLSLLWYYFSILNSYFLGYSLWLKEKKVAMIWGWDIQKILSTKIHTTYIHGRNTIPRRLKENLVISHKLTSSFYKKLWWLIFILRKKIITKVFRIY